MTLRIIVLGAALLLSGVGSAAAQTVKLEFVDGRVTLIAQNAQMRAILTEWARLGQTQIVGADRLTGPPVTLELTGSPERYALDVLLRNVPGYVVTARQTAVAGTSGFDRIMILPTTTAPRPTGSVATFGPPPPMIQQSPADIDRDEEAAERAEEARLRAEMEARMRAEQAARGIVVGPGAAPPTVNNGAVNIGPPQPFVPPAETAAPAPRPTQPGQVPTAPNPFTTLPGSSRPGEVTPVTQQPNQPPAPPNTDRF